MSSKLTDIMGTMLLLAMGASILLALYFMITLSNIH